jgi:hypothetical protein
MDIERSLSTEVAIIKNQQDYNDVVTMPCRSATTASRCRSSKEASAACPKGAKNIKMAKDFLKYLIHPKVLNELLKTGLGRNLPAMPAIVKDDQWWFADRHRAAYTQQGLLGPTVPTFWTSNPAYAQVQNEHVWQTAWAEIMKDGRRRRRRRRKRSSGSRRSFQNIRSSFRGLRSGPITRRLRGGYGTAAALACEMIRSASCWSNSLCLTKRLAAAVTFAT